MAPAPRSAWIPRPRHLAGPLLLAINQAGRIDPGHRRLTTTALYEILQRRRPLPASGPSWAWLREVKRDHRDEDRDDHAGDGPVGLSLGPPQCMAGDAVVTWAGRGGRATGVAVLGLVGGDVDLVVFAWLAADVDLAGLFPVPPDGGVGQPSVMRCHGMRVVVQDPPDDLLGDVSVISLVPRVWRNWCGVTFTSWPCSSWTSHAFNHAWSAVR